MESFLKISIFPGGYVKGRIFIRKRAELIKSNEVYSPELAVGITGRIKWLN